MTNRDQDAYVNTRARLQRLSDARFVAGWVAGFSGAHLMLRSNEAEAIASGDAFFCVLNSSVGATTFQARVTSRVADEISLTMETAPKAVAATEEVRYRADAIGGSLTVGARRIELQLEDISPHGLGGTTEVEIPQATRVGFEIEGLYGPVAGEAEVRYCRRGGDGRCRLGLLIVRVGRIDQARWNRMLGAPPAAA